MAAQIVAFPYKQRPFRYILQNDNPTPVYQRSHWLEWMSQHRDGLRRVDEKNGIFVLTEFVGLDQGAYGEPNLWKTIVLTENKITPVHGLYWTFSEATDASWFHNYVVMCITGRGLDDLEHLYDDLVKLAPG
jgi:hypothetical protein